MTDLSLPALAGIACGAALVVGGLRTSVGGGIGLTLTPVLSIFLPAQFVLALTGTMMTLADPITLRLFWRQWDGRLVRLVLPPMLLGILIGGWAISGLSDYWLKKTIGAAVLVFSLGQWAVLWGARRPAARAHWLPGSLIGLGSGVASSVAHSGGTVLNPYLAGRGLSNAAVIGTGAAVVAFSNVLKLATYWKIGFLNWRIIALSLATMPVLYAGAWLGYRVNRRIPQRWFAFVLLAIAILGSLKLLTG